MESSAKLQVATIIAILVVAISLLMNTCAMDRLEQQVIETRLAVGQGGGGGFVTGTAPASGAQCATPGMGTGRTAKGWGGATAEITCVEGAAADAPRAIGEKPLPQGDTYTSRRTSAPGSLNYYTSTEGDASTISKYVLGRLMNVDLDAPPAVIPELATSWEVSEDHLTYTYHLRRGVQFADGRPFSSADVRYSFEVMRDPSVNADHLRGSFEDVVELSTPDAYTVVVRYRQQYWKGLYTIGYNLRILNKAWFDEQIPKYAARFEVADFSIEPGKPGFGEVFNKIRSLCPGTGPYYLPGDDYDQKKPVELLQNPFFLGIQIHPTWENLAKMRWVFISDEVAAFEEFRKQKFDITVVDLNTWDDELSHDPTVTDIANYYEYDHMALAYSAIWWNGRKAPFDDPRVRVAMTHLVDRKWIQGELERGRGTVAVCPNKRIYPSYNNEIEPWAYNLEEAKRLLAEAGWTDTDGDGILDKDGKRFEFEFKWPSGRRFYQQVEAQLEDACKKVGIRVIPRPLEWSTFIEDFHERRWDAVCLYNSFLDPWIDSYEEFHSSQDVPRGGNAPGWHNAQADKLLEEMRANFDEKSRDEQYHEFCELFHEEQPMTLLTHNVVGVLQNKRFEEAKVRPTGMQSFPIWVKPENVLNK